MSLFILKWALVWTTNYTATLRIWEHLEQTMPKTLILLHDHVDIFPSSLTHICLKILVEGSGTWCSGKICFSLCHHPFLLSHPLFF